MGFSALLTSPCWKWQLVRYCFSRLTAATRPWMVLMARICRPSWTMTKFHDAAPGAVRVPEVRSYGIRPGC
jgi:hypothetical protein